MIRISIPVTFGVVGLCMACGSEGGVAKGADPGSGGGSGSGSTDGGFPAVTPKVSVLDAHPVLNETQARVYVVLSQPASATVTVQLATADGSAKAAAGDYTALT